MEQSYHMYYIHSRFGCYKALGFYRQLYSQSALPDELREGIRVITKLPNSEQSYKGKVKTHNYINRQNQSTTGKL